MLDTVFLISALLIIYSYFLYPVIVIVLSRIVSEKKYPSDFEPEVTILICAYNEEKYVIEKITNAVGTDYPKDKLNVVFVSDGSSDSTMDKARSLSFDNLKIIEIKQRHGKAHAINTALKEINSEVIVFTDANVFMDSTAVKELVMPLSAEEVGCVSGNVKLKAVTTGEILGEGLYMRYERMIFQSESLINTMVGIDGGLFAIKRKLVSPLPENIILDDMLMAMRALLLNTKIKYRSTAMATELVPALVSQEFRRKVRIATGAFQILQFIKSILLPWKNFSASVFFVSHKLLRWFSPLLLLAVLLVPVFNLTYFLYQLVLLLQTVFYLLALFGAAFPQLREKTIIYFPYYFTTINIAMLLGLFKFLFGTQSVKWEKVDR